MKLPPRSFIIVGKITKPHGIKGEVFAKYYAESLKYIENNQLYLKTEKSEAKQIFISSVKERGELVILKIKNVDTRNDAEFLRNYDLVIDEELLDYNEYESQDEQAPYLHHIIGIKAYIKNKMENNSDLILNDLVLNNENENKKDLNQIYSIELGIIEDIIFPAGQEIWLIKTPDGKEILFPAVSDFVYGFDLENEKIYLDPPEGLIELYLE